MKKRFAAAINCMDGRIQIPVIEYMRSNYMIDCLDIITEAGPIRILSEGTDRTTIENIKKDWRYRWSKMGQKLSLFQVIMIVRGILRKKRPN